MKIIHGKSRTVFVFRTIVVKFPAIYFQLAFKEMMENLKRGTLLWHIREYNYEQYGTVHQYLFNGIISNWLEFVFYQKNKHYQLLAPTYFSFFGMINIQKYYEPIVIDYTDLWCQLVELVGGIVWEDSHAFSNPENFGTIRGKLKILDYGSRGTHKVLKEYAQEIYEKFIFSYIRESKRKKLQKG